ncbi:GNAT family N-acetyltransferase [Pseudomarimonas arenosa]|uniref:GNAT family N-acetyltransferase n=1 Tax=Pseudomarimonas arenosa TaxID=2774145 RepID=A0AAW3ZQN1_9GAMM|nr:GNAT family N-acetyltransferase [Pseudomarimonas arenosa]MBD8526934.1 GNAT family N-acetyltransferase [Pseudomarimonas arenosa]
MIAEGFFVEMADFERDRSAIAAIREPVFEVEQQVPHDVVWDDLDPRSQHALARDPQCKPIGAGRLTPDFKIGRMAVLPEWRNRGVGAALLQALIDRARARHAPQVWLHAQVEAIDFYRHHGFEPEGEQFIEADIPHQLMRLVLSELPPLERDAPPPVVATEEIEFSDLDRAHELCLELLKSAKHQLWIYTRDLDPELFRGPSIEAELRRIATSGRQAQILILVQDLETAGRNGGALLALAQRLSSTVSIRQPETEEHLQFAGCYLLSDQFGVMERPIASRFEGSMQLRAPGRQRQRLDDFRQAWEHSRSATELRVQSL